MVIKMNGFDLIQRHHDADLTTYEIEIGGVIVGRLNVEPDTEGGEDDDEVFTVTDYVEDIEEDGTYGGSVVFTPDDAWSLIKQKWSVSGGGS